MIVFVALVLFYGIIVVHDIPYEIAHRRNHPHADAIHVAGWVSLFTLGVIWPFLWIWACLYREDRGWGFSEIKEKEAQLATELEAVRVRSAEKTHWMEQEITRLNAGLAALTTRLASLESTAAKG